MSKPPKQATIHVSMPGKLLEELKHAAERETRTIRNMVLVLLKEAMLARKNDVGGPG